MHLGVILEGGGNKPTKRTAEDDDLLALLLKPFVYVVRLVWAPNKMDGAITLWCDGGAVQRDRDSCFGSVSVASTPLLCRPHTRSST